MRLHVLTLTLVMTVIGAAVSHAEIKVDSAIYGAGILTVRGTTSIPRQEVVINNRFKRRSFASGRFVFRLPLLPNSCTIRLVAGTDETSAHVGNCKPPA
jgi:hypothetical protein